MHELIKRYGKSGNPKKVICLHGGTGMDDSYFYPSLKNIDAELILYKQGSLRTSETIDDLIKELDGVVDSFRGNTIYLLGHSFGGALALEYMNRFAKKIKGLILVAWVHDTKWTEFYAKNNPDVEDFDYNSLKSTNLSDDDKYKEAAVYYAPQYFTKNFVEKGEKILRDISYDKKLMMDINKSYLSDFDCKNIIQNLKIPTLGIAGSSDAIVDHDYLLDTKNINPEIKIVSMNDVGHFPFIENQNEFTQIVNDFLN